MKDAIGEWLTEKRSISEAETENMEDGRTFGYQHRKWERLKQQMAAGDELWEFCSPPESWAHRKGRQGYAVLRKGQVVDYMLTTEE
jgi:hypothetical protein